MSDNDKPLMEPDTDNRPAQARHDEDSISESSLDIYWHFNLWLLFQLLLLWFFVSFGCGIVFADWLNQFQFFGFPLGFWFAQQGSIYCFVVIVFIYIWQMRRLDHRFGVDDDVDDRSQNTTGD